MANFPGAEQLGLLEDLLEDKFYGCNDSKPLSPEKKCLVIFGAVVFFPLWLVLLIFGIVFLVRYSLKIKVNEYQMKTGIIIVSEMLHRAPGKTMAVKSTGSACSEILISDEFVDENGMLNTCKGISLRKSIEITVMKDLRGGMFGQQIADDNDKDAPHYLLHGWTDPLHTKSDQVYTDEIWTTHAHVASWAAQYSWAGRLSFSYGKFAQAIVVKDCPEILGYIYLMKVSNPKFYSRGSRVVHMKGGANAPEHTQETEGKIFARYDYGLAKHMGSFMPGDPDAYIFKGHVVQDAELKILHTYRLVKPGTK